MSTSSRIAQLTWARTAVEQVANADRHNRDRPGASDDVRRDRALATVLLEVAVAQASVRGLGPTPPARLTIAAMLGVPGRRPDVEVPVDVAQAELSLLGAMYESLHGLILDDGLLTDPDGRRKAAGAYYTPAGAVDLLLDHTLGVVLAGRDTVEQAASIRVLDPACGGGNFLDRAVLRIAVRLEALGVAAPEARRRAAECVTGVDVDPVAVVLARLGLWLRVADPALPATEFSNAIVLGDALAGFRVGESIEVSLSAFEAGGDDDRPTASAWRRSWKQSIAGDPDIVTRALAANPRRTLDAISVLWHAPKMVGAANPLDVVLALSKGEPEPQPCAVLVDQLSRRHRPMHWPLEVPGARHGYDVVVGNPPYVKSRAHGRSHPGLRRRLTRTQPECAGGQWNLFVPFVALAADLTRLGGRSALLVPNAVVAADFAAPLQSHVLGRLEEVLDFTSADLFEEASVHVAALVTSGSAHDREVAFTRHGRGLEVTGTQGVDKALLRRLPSGYWCLPLLGPDVDVPTDRLLELLAQPRTIGDVAVVRDGCSTTEAYALKPLLAEVQEDEAKVFRFANTGTIDPSRFLWGEKKATYLGEKYLRPVIARDRLEREFPKRAAEAVQPKVLLAGLSARLEAVADPSGDWLCGKSAVQVLVADAAEAERLAAWLNTDEMSALYRALFGLAGFGGAGMNVAPALVAQLPWPNDAFES